MPSTPTHPSSPKVRWHDRLIRHTLKETIRSRGDTLGKMSQRVLDRSPDYLSRVVRGQRPLRLNDLLTVLDVLDVHPVEFFSEALAGTDSEAPVSDARRGSQLDLEALEDWIVTVVHRAIRERLDEALRRRAEDSPP